MHLLHRKSSPQELVLVDYDEDVADSRLSLALAWPRNPTRGGVHRVQGLHEQVGGFLQSIQIRSMSHCWLMILGMKPMVLVCSAAVFKEVREAGNCEALNAKWSIFCSAAKMMRTDYDACVCLSLQQRQ